MRLLYLSCHSVLEFSEIQLFRELGVDVFSPGAYVEPRNPGDPTMRPGLMDMAYNPEEVAMWHALGKPGIDNKELLTREFVDRFDAVMVMHIPKWIITNWEAMKHKPVIWRTIGQSIQSRERELSQYRDAGLKIVRYSPKERNIPDFIGEDAMIRFYQDPDEFTGWTGQDRVVTTFCQSMPQRAAACNYSLYQEVTTGLPRRLYGPGNEAAGEGVMGKVPFPDLKQAMRDSRCYFATGTHPASYTLNFMEAAMTGIPVVAPGPEYGNARYFPGHDLYEVHEMLEQGVSGLYSDDPEELRLMILSLLDSPTLAASIGAAGRAMAIKHFGKDAIKLQWKEFFKTL